MIITVEQDEGKAIYELPSGSGSDDMKAVFASIMCFLTFHPETVAECLYEEKDI